MKTLDEVIIGIKEQMGLGDPILIDALHYLKEYQEIKQHLACMDRGEIRGNATQVTNNPPLTWEDLRQMKGKPVWIHFNNGTKGHWDIVRDIGRIYEGEDRDMWMWFYVGDKKAKTTYGKWQAYKKKRE